VLRVALIAGTLGQGGAEKQLVLAARALRDAGVSVAVFCSRRGEHYERELEEDGLPVTTPLGDGRLARLAALQAFLSHERPHVVQAGHTFVNLWTALGAARVGALSVGALRSSLAYARAGNGVFTPWHLRAPHALSVNSKAAEKEVLESGWTRRPVYLVPNAIECAAALLRNGESRPPTVAFVGRLIPVKRGCLFVDALALARKERPELVGVVAGDGPERAAMEERARALGLLPSGVRFLGRRDDVPQVLRAADMLLLCSAEEGFPNVLLEAMAAGLPVVTTPAGDAADVVRNGETGFVAEGNAGEIAARLALLAGSPELARRMGDAGRRRAEDEYGFGKLSTRLLEVYRDLAGRRRHEAALDFFP
jgi:glycosyltransferase involved in cell wall biosynthesis